MDMIKPEVLDKLLQRAAAADPSAVPDKTNSEKAIGTLLGSIFCGNNFTPDVEGIAAAIALFQSRYQNVTSGPHLGILSNGVVSGILRSIGSVYCGTDSTSTTAKLTDPLLMPWNEDCWIRYYIDNSVPPTIESIRTESLIAEAWSMWASYAKNLLVRRVESPQSGAIKISNNRVANGTGSAPVLGPGRFRTSGEVLLDFQEIVDRSNAPALLRNLAVHEFGHVLGLSHDFEPDSIMHPVIGDKSSISRRDAEKIGSIYGRPEEQQFGIGTIKFFDPKKMKGVIAPSGVKGSSNDVYFETNTEDAKKLKQDELVQFVLAENSPQGPVARNVSLLKQREGGSA